jgi:hypothetical protein
MKKFYKILYYDYKHNLIPFSLSNIDWDFLHKYHYVTKDIPDFETEESAVIWYETFFKSFMEYHEKIKSIFPYIPDEITVVSIYKNQK